MFYMPCRHRVLFWPVFIAQSIQFLTHSSVDVTAEGRPITNLIPASDVNTNRRQTGGLVVNLWQLRVLLQTGTATPKIPASSRFIKTSIQCNADKKNISSGLLMKASPIRSMICGRGGDGRRYCNHATKERQKHGRRNT